MVMSSWEEIKRLAADFRAAQLGSVAQKLTERNCIEVVQQLQAQGLLQVFYTLDAKSYLTPEEVRKEILEELEAHGGRINLPTLQQAINVDYTVVESRVHELLRSVEAIDASGGNLRLVNGELIDASYMRHVATQIRDMLLVNGHITIGDLVQRFELPTAFILDVIYSHQGTILQARLEGDTLFTEEFVRRQKAVLRGYLSATTKAVNLQTVHSHCPMPEKVFHSLLDGLLQTVNQSSAVCGSLNTNKTVFTPQIFSQSQAKWAQNFFDQNHCLTFDDMRRQGITHPVQFCQKNLPKDSHVLTSAVVHPSCSQGILGHLEECVRSATWIDLSNYLPSSLTAQDINQLTKPLLKSFSGKVSTVCQDTVIISEACLTAFKERLQPILSERAERLARENPKILASLQAAAKGKRVVKEDTFRGEETVPDPPLESSKSKNKNRSAGGSSGGGGVGGGQRAREVKTKAVKNKYFANKRAEQQADGDYDSIDNSADLTASEALGGVVFMESEEFIEQLRQHFGQDALDEMLEELEAELRPMFQREFVNRLQSVFLQTTGSGKNRANLSECQERLTNVLAGIQLFERGAEALHGDAELSSALRKHLLRSDCTDLFTTLLGLLVLEYGVEADLGSKPIQSLTHEQRTKLIQQFPADIAKVSLSMNASLKKEGENLQEFISVTNELSGKLGLHLRVGDKKREKVQCQEIAAQLMNILSTLHSALDDVRSTGDITVLDPGQALLITVRLLCQGYTNLPLNAPGRLVPKLITWLQPHLSEQQYSTLRDFEKLVVDYSKSSAPGSTDTSAELQSRLLELFPRLYELALLWKKMPLSKK